MTGDELYHFLHEKKLTVVGFAAYLNVTVQTVHLWTRSGDKEIPHKYDKAINYLIKGDNTND